ncbi:hypothetical protein CQY22_013480 [Mycolicibacterium brumae]|uniref:Uncharacterized protein n=2 Tax=Mycolicibacterium brumae TaxID=85968 RepID=A0A2G5P7D0_9MYCO|nr:hypothetical protein CQY22_013480 [Mycolicibacterium brumae]RWA15171.1 hypothetical protein MBRU_11165 [Mycolicibacterium brumae DSM 44177]
MSGFAVAAALTVAASPASADPETFCGVSSRGANVFAGNANTSCPFAMAVAETYHNKGQGSLAFSVLSPVTGQSYTMNCYNAGSRCEGGQGALVYLRH